MRLRLRQGLGRPGQQRQGEHCRVGRDPPQPGESHVLCLTALRRGTLERLAYIPDLRRTECAC